MLGAPAPVANARNCSRASSVLSRPADAGAHPLLFHQRLEALLVDAEPALRGQLEREVEREPERVVQAERLVGADALLTAVARAVDHVVEQLQAGLERAVER